MRMCGSLLDGVATGHRAGLHLLHAVAFMAAVHRNIVALLCGALLRGTVISVNGALVPSAASAGNNHQCRTRLRRIDEKKCK